MNIILSITMSLKFAQKLIVLTVDLDADVVKFQPFKTVS